MDYPLATLALAAALGLAGLLRAQDSPRPLPRPDVPLEAVTPPIGPMLDGPYSGPPAGIDGPSRLPPDMEMLPGPAIGSGITAEDLIPFADGPITSDGLYGDYYPLPQSQKLSPYKDGFFQKLSLSAAWFGNSGDPEDLGATEIETLLTVALPLPIREWPLLITPGYNVAYLTGPSVTDLPPRLHNAYVDFTWVPQIVNRYTLVLGVAPSVISDFESSGNGAFRVTGKALLLVDWTERLQFRAGVLYLNRDNVRLLPVGGLIWKPTDWSEYEIFFPKPRAGWRFNVGPGFEDWFFTTAEFGGNTWAVVRTSGDQDRLTYLDYRILLGVERRLNGGAGFRVEVGYVFGRDVEFESGDGDFQPHDTILIRGGVTF